MRAIDKSHVLRVNATLGSFSPTALCNGLESLVAMLRNAESASNFDVELYFADYSKLMLKFQRINPADLTLKLVRKHGAYLKHVLNDFTDRTSLEYSYLAGLDCFIRWGICFSQYAERVLE